MLPTENHRCSIVGKNIVEGQVCDGCSYELQITYADKRKEIINGDVAGGTFDSILEKFVHSVFPE